MVKRAEECATVLLQAAASRLRAARPRAVGEECWEELRIQVRIAERHPRSQALRRHLHVATPGLRQVGADGLARRRRSVRRSIASKCLAPVGRVANVFCEDVDAVEGTRKLRRVDDDKDLRLRAKGVLQR